MLIVEESSLVKDDMSSTNVEILPAVTISQKFTLLTGNMTVFYVVRLLKVMSVIQSVTW